MDLYITDISLGTTTAGIKQPTDDEKEIVTAAAAVVPVTDSL